jgi:hypothetical protein
MNRLKRLIIEIHHRSFSQVLPIYVGGSYAAAQGAAVSERSES